MQAPGSAGPNEAFVYIERRGARVAIARLRRESIPFNFDAIIGIRGTITRVTKVGDLLLLQVPVKLRREHSLYRNLKPGDVMIAPQFNCLAVLVGEAVPGNIELFKAGEVVEGLEKLASLQSGENVSIKVTPGSLQLGAGAA